MQRSVWGKPFSGGGSTEIAMAGRSLTLPVRQHRALAMRPSEDSGGNAKTLSKLSRKVALV
jgi:hypothetical protein